MGSPLRRDGRGKGLRHFAVAPRDNTMSQTLPEFERKEVRMDPAASSGTLPRVASSTGSSPLSKSSSAPIIGTPSKAGDVPEKSRSRRMMQRERALRAFDQRLTKDFEHVDRVSTPTSQRAHSPSRTEDILSDMARRENFKKDKYSKQIDRGASFVGQKGGPEQAGEDAQSGVKVLTPQAFLDDVKGVEGFIEELAKSIRLEHLDGSSPQDKRRQAEMEAARKRKEDELRRARKKEQEARDPHRKIQFKLEFKRRFGEGENADKANTEADGVPMQVIEFSGFKGKEQVKLVDPRALRCKCIGMDEGDRTVSQLLDTQQRREQSERFRHFARSTLTDPSPSSPMSPMHGSMESDPGPRTEQDERFEQIRAVARARQVDRMLYKLSRTRGEPNMFGLPYSIDLGGHDGNGDRLMGFGYKCKAPSPSVARKIAQTHGRAFLVRHGSALAGSSENLEKFMLDLDGEPTKEKAAKVEPQKTSDEADKPGSAGSKTKVVGEAVRQESKMPDPAIRVAVRKRWLQVRSLTQWLLIHKYQTRRADAIEVVKALIKQCGEWARVRRAMRRLVESVAMLQTRARQFLFLKRKRVDEMGKTWQRVEEDFLGRYFKDSMKKIMQDKAEEIAGLQKKGGEPLTPRRAQTKKARVSTLSKKSRQAHDFYEKMSNDLENETLQFDISGFKIPPKKRRAVISRWYMDVLQRHVKTQQMLLTTVQNAIRSERELADFLKSLGAEDDQVAFDHTLVAKSTAHLTVQGNVAPFYNFTEELALKLICETAKSMQDEPPFENHPANKDLAEQRMRKKFSSADAAKESAFSMAVIVGKPEQPEGDPQQESGESQPADIEDILNFTPRLREIAEEQTVEYRQANADTSPRNAVAAQVEGAYNPM